MSAPQHLLYIVSEWGTPTETFVRREVAAAQRAGATITVLSLKPPVSASDPRHEVRHLPPHRVGLGLAAGFARAPVRVGRLFAAIISKSRPSTLAANLYAAAAGIAAIPSMRGVEWIHAHFAWVAATAALAMSRVTGAPFSVMAHAFDVFDERYVDSLTGAKLTAAEVVGVVSPSVAREVEARFHCRTTVIPMGVAPDYVVHDVPTPRPAHIVSVGSLLPKKGHDVLLRALALLEVPWTATVVGEGAELGPLQALADDLGVADRVTFAGRQPPAEIRRLLDAAGVFSLACRVTPSGDRDGLPVALVEAMARGVPVVTTAVSGITDLLADGRGRIVEPEDPPALAHALTEALTDVEETTAMARRALEHVRVHQTSDAGWRLLHEQMAASR